MSISRRFAGITRRRGGYIPRRVSMKSSRFKRRFRVPGRSRGFLRRGGYYGRYAGNNPESKFFDTALTFSFDVTPGPEVSLNLIPQGVTESTRVGRKCTIKSIGFKGHIDWNADMATTEYARTRIDCWIVLDMQANGANAAFLDVYETASVNSFRNLANSSRFKVLKHFSWVPSRPSTTTTDNWVSAANTVVNCPVTKLQWFKKCNIPIEFSSTTGAVTEVRSNNIVVFAASESGDDSHVISGVARVRFMDG